MRRVEIYRFDDGAPTRVYEHELITSSPHVGDPTAMGDVSRTLVERWITDILFEHDAGLISTIVSPHPLIHRTAMPGEAAYHGTNGASAWVAKCVGHDFPAQVLKRGA